MGKSENLQYIKLYFFISKGTQWATPFNPLGPKRLTAYNYYLGFVVAHLTVRLSEEKPMFQSIY